VQEGLGSILHPNPGRQQLKQQQLKEQQQQLKEQQQQQQRHFGSSHLPSFRQQT